MSLVNEQQLVCGRCEGEAFDTPEGYIHRDGTPLEDCGDDQPMFAGDLAVA